MQFEQREMGDKFRTFPIAIPHKEIWKSVFRSDRYNLEQRLKRGDFQLLDASRLNLAATIARTAAL